MNTCGTCKYLGERCSSDFDDKGDEILSEFHVCDFIKHNADFNVRFEATAYVIDGSGYRAALCVKDDFGCNLWAARS